MGGAGLAGTYAIGIVLKSRLYSVLIVLPLAMAVIAIGLVEFGSSAAASTVLLALWGMIGTAAPVGWWMWLAKVLPEDAEAGGGLMVAAIQLAITLGATAGGLLFDSSGYRATFAASAAILCASAGVALLASCTAREEARADPVGDEAIVLEAC